MALWIGGCAAYGGGRAVRAPEPLRVAPPSAGHVTEASWYGPGFQGRRTSSGEIFNRNHLTAASRTLPIGTRVRVTNLHNGRSVVVRINDRGPYVRGRGIDLSERAAERIGVVRRGVAPVRVQRLDALKVPSHRTRIRLTEREHERRYRYRRVHYSHLYHRERDYHRPVRGHYYYASLSERPRTKPRMVASPVGDWLLGMLP